MIRIDLLRYEKKYTGAVVAFPWRIIFSILLILTLSAAVLLIWRPAKPAREIKVLRKKIIAPLKRELTPFDVVEDIVDDIHGGRFKIRTLNRISSPKHLSVNERKIYERFYVKNAFDVFNACIRPGMGFNTITLDNEGNFFLYGVAGSDAGARDFRDALSRQESILQADTLDFRRVFGRSELFFALKGFLSFNIIDRFYESDAWNETETIPASPKTVLAEVVRLGKQNGVTVFKRIEWGGDEEYGADKKHVLRLQAECPYPALMRWIKSLYQENCQIGFSSISLTSIGPEKILVAAELYVYSKN